MSNGPTGCPPRHAGDTARRQWPSYPCLGGLRPNFAGRKRNRVDFERECSCEGTNQYFFKRVFHTAHSDLSVMFPAASIVTDVIRCAPSGGTKV